jgi:ABC-2 type transport system permease protein
MIRLIRAELLKLRSTQVWFWLLLASLALTAIGVIAGLAPSTGVQNIHDAAAMFGTATTADIAVFVLGVLAVTTEFRYQTITPTVLITPSRWTLVTAKMITYLLVGAVYSALCVALEVAMAAPWLHAKGLDVPYRHGAVPHTLIAVFVIVMLMGLVGLGAGALIKNQIVAVTVGLLVLLVLENLVAAIPKVKYAFAYTPSGGAQGLLATDHDSRIVNGVHLLPVAGSVAVLLLWALIPAALGAAYSLNRDIT